MNLSNSAKLLIPIGIFIILLMVSSFDFAVTVAVSFYFYLSRKNYLTLFIASIVIFFIDILLDNFDINIRYISDLSIDAYLMFATGVILYLQSRKDFIALTMNSIDFMRLKLATFPKKTILKLILSIFISILLLPIFGGFVAVVTGYGLFSYIDKQFNGKIAMVVGLIFLVLAAVFLLADKSLIAEEMGNYVLLFLAIGTFQEFIKLAKRERPQVIKETLWKVNPSLLSGLISFFLSFTLIYFLFPGLPLFNLKFPSSQISLSTPSSSPTVIISTTPTDIPAPTAIIKVTTESAKLAIFVLNGTEINGLASSTAAKLKDNGFTNIKIGNASKTDYKTWEVSIKKQDEALINFLKKILDLNTLVINESTQGGKFDLEIIAGEEK